MCFTSALPKLGPNLHVMPRYGRTNIVIAVGVQIILWKRAVTNVDAAGLPDLLCKVAHILVFTLPHLLDLYGYHRPSIFMASEACCTCATLLISTSPPYDEKTEKPLAQDRQLDCCGRTICALCISRNPRFQTYCPFCQISTAPTALPAAGLREPPAYSSRPASPTKPLLESLNSQVEAPPSYVSLPPRQDTSARPNHASPTKKAPDVLHHLRTGDTITSLSLLYHVPTQILRTHNNIFTDSLLAARKTCSIPGTHYQGPSLSSTPVLSEEEEEKQMKIRRWMMATKCAEYEVATLYLGQCKWNLDGAVEGFKADEKWERENPMKGKGKMKGSKGTGVGLTGQLLR